MAARSEVISVDELWNVFDMERRRAWEGHDAEVGSPEWNIEAGKIDTINNICHAVYKILSFRIFEKWHFSNPK